MNPRSVISFLIMLAVSPPTPAAAQPKEGRTEAMVLVQPFGASYQIAVIYPQAVPHAQVRNHLKQLAAQAGWSLRDVEIKDQQVSTNPGFGSQQKLATQTGASALAAGAGITRDGGFYLQPYLEAFASLKQIEVLFVVGASDAFAGLREFSSPSVSVRLLQAGGPYRYRIAVDRSAGALPKLPLTQSAAPAQSAAPRASAAGAASDWKTGLAYVVVIAAASGLAVLLLWTALAHIRTRGRVRSARGTTRRV